MSDRCLACDQGVPLVNVTADRDDLPDLWAHRRGGDPGTTSPCKRKPKMRDWVAQWCGNRCGITPADTA